MRDKRKLKTQIKQNTTKPEWNEEFQLLVHEPEHQHLTLHMFDYDVLSVDDEIGRASFPIRNLRNGEEEEIDIEVKEHKGQPADQMMVSLGWAGLGWAVLCCAVLGWAGLGWAGLGWAVLQAEVNCICCLQIMKLVGKFDTALDKLRSLTHFIGRKPGDGPCTIKVKVRPVIPDTLMAFVTYTTYLWLVRRTCYVCVIVVVVHESASHLRHGWHL